MPKSMYKGKGDAKTANRGGSKVMKKGGVVKGGAAHANRGGSKVMACGGSVRKYASGGYVREMSDGGIAGWMDKMKDTMHKEMYGVPRGYKGKGRKTSNAPKTSSDSKRYGVRSAQYEKKRREHQALSAAKQARGASKQYAGGGMVKGDRSHANDYNVHGMYSGGSVGHTKHTKSHRKTY